MNKAKVLVSVFVFYATISVIFYGVGKSAYTPPSVEIDEITIPYSDIYKSINESQLTSFQLGEYDLTNRISIHNVYVLNYSVDTSPYMVRRAESLADYFLGPITFQSGIFKSIAKDWNKKYGTMETLYPGDEIYLYPRVTLNVKDWIRWNAWVVCGVFDEQSGINEWYDTYRIAVPTSFSKFEFIGKLHLGTMGSCDRYYLIDIIYTDINLTGLSLGEIYEYLVPEGKAQIAERYGGVVKGELHKIAPTEIAFHELQLNRDFGGGVWGTIKEIFYMWKEGMKMMTDTGEYGVAAIILEAFVYAPFLIILGWIIYKEAQSWIPFLRGGD